MSARVARTAVGWRRQRVGNRGSTTRSGSWPPPPDAFLAADDGRAITATVSCALCRERYAFVGFFIARPDLRSRGVGSASFDRALARAGRRVAALDSVLVQQAHYERRGFVPAYRNVRWRACEMEKSRGTA